MFAKIPKSSTLQKENPKPASMSNHDDTAAVAAFLVEVALAADGAVLGTALAAIAVRSFVKFVSTSSSLAKIQNAPSVTVSDLRSLISKDNGEDKLVIVRGEVETKSAVDGSIRRGNDVLISHESKEKGVVLQRTQTCIYNEWKGLFGWTSHVRSFFNKYRKEQEVISFRTVPFVLAEGCGHFSSPDYVTVNLSDSRHPLPLTTVYHHLEPVKTPHSFLRALFSQEYLVGVVEEEKIIPVGNVITALGSCCSKNGILEIKSCNDLPYFLSEMTKAQMVGELDFRTKAFFWSGVIIGSLSIGILGFSAIRNWTKFKAWRQQRRAQRPPPPTLDDLEQLAAIEDAIEEDLREISDGELCVICLMRRKRSAFVPCGHLVCCQRCALSVEREPTPLCPVCRQAIQKSLIIFGS